ncbi:MAG: hypothetical protein QOD14_1995 [Solirubrobacterales bacterium]|jgi:hypothetical protein|nr:hypothetical protein [Solirubrobacterales bacterium]
MSLTAESEQGAPSADLRGRLAMPAEDLAWLGTIVAAIVLAAVFAWLAPALAKLMPSPNQTFFRAWALKINPEPLEDVRAVFALATPFAVAAGVLLLGSRRPASRSFNPLIIGAQVAGIALLALCVVRQPHALPLQPDYLEPHLLSVPILVAGALIGVVMMEFILWWSGPAPRPLRQLRRLAGRRWLVLGVAALVTVVFLLPAVITDATVGHNGVWTSKDVGLHAEDYLSVVNGRTPMVNYIGEYANVLPFAIAPLLAALGSSVTAFTILMCVLSAVAFLAIFGVFTEVTRRPWLALGLYAPFLALALFPWHDDGPFRQFDGNYYAILPDRLLGPFVLAWLCALKIRGRRIPTWALFLFAGLTVINNTEFGVGALIASALALVLGSERDVPLSRRLVDLGRDAAIGLAAAVAIVCAITLVRAGSLPNPALLSYYSRLVLRQSYGLVPMPSLGLHWVMYATYAAALLTAAIRYVRVDPDRMLTAMLGFSGAFGLITGMYFVGRSIELQLMILFPVWSFSLALVAWSAAGALRSARADRGRLVRLLLPAAAALIGFGVMVSAIDRVSPPWRQVSRLEEGGGGAYDLLNAQRFIESHTQPGDHVLVIGTPVDHRLADRAGVTNVSPLNSLIALVSSAEADRSLDQLQAEHGTEVFETVTAPNPINPLTRIPEFATILRQRGYHLVEQDPSSGLRLWRD